MAEATTPTAGWAYTFSNILDKVVDVGAQVAVSKLADSQEKTLAEQQTAQVQAQASAQAQVAQAQAQAAVASDSADWKKYALIGGGVLVGAVVLIVLFRRK